LTQENAGIAELFDELTKRVKALRFEPGSAPQSEQTMLLFHLSALRRKAAHVVAAANPPTDSAPPEGA
jgi:hypothetical protein